MYAAKYRREPYVSVSRPASAMIDKQPSWDEGAFAELHPHRPETAARRGAEGLSPREGNPRLFGLLVLEHSRPDRTPSARWLAPPTRPPRLPRPADPCLLPSVPTLPLSSPRRGPSSSPSARSCRHAG
jgi:hypothetical protein